MALRTKVKVDKITNLSDARYCAGMGVDYLTFPLSTISNKLYQNITQWITGPMLGLETEVITDDLDSLLHQYKPDFIQIPLPLLPVLTGHSFEHWIVAMPTLDWESSQMELLSLQHKIDYLLFTRSSGNFEEDNHIIRVAATHFKIFIGFDIHEGTIDHWLNSPIVGISLKGQEELKPGMQDYQHLSDILERLETQ